MQRTEKVYGVTVTDTALLIKIKEFAKWQSEVQGRSITETTAIRMMAERYANLSFSMRSAIERKIRWQQHRNRGFRRLTTFDGKKTTQNC